MAMDLSSLRLAGIPCRHEASSASGGRMALVPSARYSLGLPVPARALSADLATGRAKSAAEARGRKEEAGGARAEIPSVAPHPPHESASRSLLCHRTSVHSLCASGPVKSPTEGRKGDKLGESASSPTLAFSYTTPLRFGPTLSLCSLIARPAITPCGTRNLSAFLTSRTASRRACAGRGSRAAPRE